MTPHPSPPDDQPEERSYKKLWVGLAIGGVVILIVLAVGVLLAFGYIRRTIESTEVTLPLLQEEPLRNHIAFVGNDANLWLVSAGGEEPRQITSDGRGYRFPTWSPDGHRLAFVGPAASGNAALYVSPTRRSRPQIIFDEPDSAPFYLYWAPDSRLITFLTQEPEGLAMRAINPAQPGAGRMLGQGSPFYWAWSPQSDQMLLHVGGSRLTSEDAHISLLANRRDAERTELDFPPGRFQAPVWSSDGQHIFYIAINEQGLESIQRAEAATLETNPVTNLGGFTHMVLSPDNQRLAYLQLEPGMRPPFGRAYLVDTDGQNHGLLMERPAASIYWSPDSKKLALLSLSRGQDGPTAAKIDGRAAPLPQEIVFRWWIYNLETEELDPLLSFSPTGDFLQTVPFFDQYHLSLTFWSPDSRYFLVTEKVDEEGRGKIWAVDTTDQEEPLEIGPGTLAVWSWR